MSDSRRVLRVERELKEILAQVLHQGLKIPLPGYSSVVHVDASADLRSAKVFVRVAGSDQDRGRAEELLVEQRAYIQRLIADRLQARYCPVLRFVVGAPPNVAPDDNIERLLANLNRSRI